MQRIDLNFSTPTRHYNLSAASQLVLCFISNRHSSLLCPNDCGSRKAIGARTWFMRGMNLE